MAGCASEGSGGSKECGPGTDIECDKDPVEDTINTPPDTAQADTKEPGIDTKTPGNDVQLPTPASNLPPPTLLTCKYPIKQLLEGNSGVEVGNILLESLSWEGYPSMSDTAGTVKVSDYFDCDGTKGYDVLLFDTSQFG